MYSIYGAICVMLFYPVSYGSACVESQLLGRPTIRHRDCDRIVEEGVQCLSCKGHRNTLHAIAARIEKSKASKENCTSASSHVNYVHLSSPEKNRRLSTLHQAVRTAQRQVGRLQARLTEATVAVGEVVAPDTHESLRSIMTENESSVYKSFPHDSFGRIFWDQQKKAAEVSTSSRMRWHPLIIKWCIHLRHLSSGCYEAMRKTGCLSLPSQRTLRDYTHFAKAVSGFSTAVDQQLIEAAEIATCPEWKKCVVVLLDEMNIREDLVYNKFTGKSCNYYSHATICKVYAFIHVLTIMMHGTAYNPIAGEFVGFTDLGDINTHIANVESQLQSGTVPTKPLAKCVLVLMVRGLNSGLQFPYAQFPSASLRGDQLFHIVWRAIGRLQRYGFHVLGLTCDGLAANRQMFRLHVPKGCSEIVHKASNPFAIHFPTLLFFSDPPIFLKQYEIVLPARAGICG